jgi:hypothetical protein
MLLPSLYGLQGDGLLPRELRILGTARSDLTRRFPPAGGAQHRTAGAGGRARRSHAARPARTHAILRGIGRRSGLDATR